MLMLSVTSVVWLMTTDFSTRIMNPEKIKLMLIGTVVSVFVSLTSVLITAYVGNFATKAELSQVKQLIIIEKTHREKDVALIKKDIEYIKTAVDDIRELLKK